MAKAAKIKLTYAEVRDARLALNVLSGRKMPVKIAVSIFRLMRALDPHFDQYERTRQTLLVSMGRRDENGNPLTDAAGNILPRNPKEFSEAIDELCADKVEIKGERLNLDDIVQGDELEPGVIYGLGPLVVIKASSNSRRGG